MINNAYVDSKTEFQKIFFEIYNEVFEMEYSEIERMNDFIELEGESFNAISYFFNY